MGSEHEFRMRGQTSRTGSAETVIRPHLLARRHRQRRTLVTPAPSPRATYSASINAKSGRSTHPANSSANCTLARAAAVQSRMRPCRSVA